MPKSSSAIDTPISRSRRRDSIVFEPVWNTVSVSSSSRALAGNPVTSSALAMWSTKSLSKNCGGDTLIATHERCQPWARQAAAVEVAERSTQSVRS